MEDIFDDIEKSFTILRDVVRHFPDRYHENNKDIEQLQKEVQDYLHLVEFVPLNAHQGWKVSNELGRVQRARRKRKDQNEMLSPMIPLLKKLRNHLQEMDKVVGELRKVKNIQENRSYKCKVRDDLQDSFDKNKVVHI